MSGLVAERLSVTLAGRAILRGVDLDLSAGGVTVVIGPNGCGKSTLLRALAGIVVPTSGEVRLDGAPLGRIPRRDLARRLAFLPQSPETPEGIRLRALVERGRTPHMAAFRGLSGRDVAAVNGAIAATALGDLEGRRVDRLSGGQRQRAWIALTLAQETGTLLLDEPTTFLDLPHQIELLRMVRRLQAESGRRVTMVLHDINLALQFADRIVGMREGRILFDGAPERVVTPDALATLFGMAVRLVSDDGGGRPVVVAG